MQGISGGTILTYCSCSKILFLQNVDLAGHCRWMPYETFGALTTTARYHCTFSPKMNNGRHIITCTRRTSRQRVSSWSHEHVYTCVCVYSLYVYMFVYVCIYGCACSSVSNSGGNTRGARARAPSLLRTPYGYATSTRASDTAAAASRSRAHVAVRVCLPAHALFHIPICVQPPPGESTNH